MFFCHSYYHNILPDYVEKYHENSLIPGHLVKWIITEDGIIPCHQFESEYESYFSSHGIPTASIRECVSSKTGETDLATLLPRIKDIENRLTVLDTLSNSSTGFRTATRIAALTGIPEQEVESMLQDEQLAVRQLEQEYQGYPLFTLRSGTIRVQKNRSRLKPFVTKISR